MSYLDKYLTTTSGRILLNKMRANTLTSDEYHDLVASHRKEVEAARQFFTQQRKLHGEKQVIELMRKRGMDPRVLLAKSL